MLLSLGLTGLVNNSVIKPGLYTDHSQISLTLSMQNTTRGPGLWKFNSSLLHDTNYVNLVKEVITETVAINKEASHQLLWDTVKDWITGHTIRYSTIKMKCMKRQKDLEEKLNVLENVRDDNPEDENTINEILHTKEYLNEMYEEQTRGAHIRCKVKWYEESEKSTKYFLNLEKMNYCNKVISKLRREHNKLITNPKGDPFRAKRLLQRLDKTAAD